MVLSVSVSAERYPGRQNWFNVSINSACCESSEHAQMDRNNVPAIMEKGYFLNNKNPIPKAAIIFTCGWINSIHNFDIYKLFV